jgi:hypothetical protein
VAALAHSYVLSHKLSSPPHLLPYARNERERDNESDIEIGENFWGLASVTSPYLSNYSEVGLDPFRGHAGVPVGPHELGVHDGDGARNLSCARGPRIPHANAGICGDFNDILQVRIRCAITPISLFVDVVLLLGATPSDPLRDLAYHDLCDSMRGLHGD